MKLPFLNPAAKLFPGSLAVMALLAAIVVVPAWWAQGASPVEAGDAAEGPPANEKSTALQSASPAEARMRSQLLHEMIHGALQVMHRDFFREDEGLTLPSRSLEDVFSEMEERWQVEIHWLTVNAAPMNVDHNPRDEFEKQAVAAIASGEKEFEAVEGNRYRYVGMIRLGSQCLQCHVPKRTSLEDRAAGLAITMPIQND